MIVDTDPFRSSPRIGREKFAQVLQERGAFAVLQERDPREYYDIILSVKDKDGRTVDPLFVLSMFNHESSMGRAGVAQTTHSWGNTRKPTFGGVQVVGEVPGRSGTFPVFQNWKDGLISTVARLLDHNWVYYERNSIRDIFDWPPNPAVVWAPAGDMNNPASYLGAMLNFMNRYAENAVEPPPQPSNPITGQCIVPAGSPNRPGTIITPFFITVHETANYNAGAGAQSHCNYIRSQGAFDRQVSWHVSVDKDHALQHLPFNERGNHTGTAQGNNSSLGMELCVNSDGDWVATMRRGAGVVAYWMKTFNIPITRVVQHHYWGTGTACPARLRAGDWGTFIGMVVSMSGPRTEVIEVPGVGTFTVTDPFLDYMYKNWDKVGYPRTNAQTGTFDDGAEGFYQYFDKTLLESVGGGIRHANLGAMYLSEALEEPPPPTEGLAEEPIRNRLGVINEAARDALVSVLSDVPNDLNKIIELSAPDVDLTQ